MNIVMPMVFRKFDQKNNIIVAQKNLAMSLGNRTGSFMPPVTIDYNCYYAEDDFALSALGSYVYYPTLADWQSAFQLDSHSLFDYPDFVDSLDHDYRLTGSSVAIDAGVIIPGINEKAYSGLAPDMGAYEYGVSGAGNEPRSSLELYPNPTNGLVHVAINQPSLLRIYDLAGRLLLEQEADGPVALDLSGLASGCYVVEVLEEQVIRGRVMKM
jgi:hypothetical protein